jgi:hypothetical protein
MSGRHGRYCAALGALVLATVAMAQQQTGGPKLHDETAAKVDTGGLRPAAHDLSVYETQSLMISREANDIARVVSHANVRQADAAWWQVLLGGVAAGLTAIAAGAAIAAAIYAKKAADHTEAGAKEARRSADTAEDALRNARNDAFEQAERFEKQLKLATDAAELSGKQFDILSHQTDILTKQHAIGRLAYLSEHRPRISLREVYFIQNSEGDEILYSLVNEGGSDAIIRESWVFLERVSNADPVRNPRSFGHDDLGAMEFDAGEVKDIAIPMNDFYRMLIRTAEPPMSPLNALTGESPSATTYFTGAILYEDAAGKMRRSVFRRMYSPGRRAFFRLDGDDFEYAD